MSMIELLTKSNLNNENGLLYATILKSILQYTLPEGSEDTFKTIPWPWKKHVFLNDFIEVLKEALTLWESIYKMVLELSSKSKIGYIGAAFKNANYVLKKQIKILKIDELL